MTDSVTIKHYVNPEGLIGSNVWIVHEGVRYYSRVNYQVDDTPGQRNYMLQLFRQRQKIYLSQDVGR